MRVQFVHLCHKCNICITWQEQQKARDDIETFRIER